VAETPYINGRIDEYAGCDVGRASSSVSTAKQIGSKRLLDGKRTAGSCEFRTQLDRCWIGAPEGGAPAVGRTASSAPAGRIAVDLDREV
jgi:hypothetical protein